MREAPEKTDGHEGTKLTDSRCSQVFPLVFFVFFVAIFVALFLEVELHRELNLSRIAE
jgi:hypothetical protein